MTETKTPTPNIYGKLAHFQSEMVKFTKDAENPHFKSAYLSLDGLNEILLPICTSLGLLVHHYSDGNALVTCVTNLDNTEEQISSIFPITQTDPQKIGASYTYGKRYNLGAIFNIITEVDDDGNSATKTAPRKFEKSETDEMLEQMNEAEDELTLKQIFAKLYTLGKTEKQKGFFKTRYELNRKRLGL